MQQNIPEIKIWNISFKVQYKRSYVVQGNPAQDLLRYESYMHVFVTTDSSHKIMYFFGHFPLHTHIYIYIYIYIYESRMLCSKRYTQGPGAILSFIDLRPLRQIHLILDWIENTVGGCQRPIQYFLSKFSWSQSISFVNMPRTHKRCKFNIFHHNPPDHSRYHSHLVGAGAIPLWRENVIGGNLKIFSWWWWWW